MTDACIDIGGTVTSQFGRLTVSGAATLDGTLNLALVNGFSPAIGNSFPVMTFGSRTGQFITINGTALGNGKQFTPAYSATNLTLNVTAAAPAPAGITWGIVAPATPFPNFPADPGNPLRITSFARTASGAEFQLQTAPGGRYRLEGTGDLLRGEWSTRIERLDGTGALYQFLDPAALGLEQYFYRFRLIP